MKEITLSIKDLFGFFESKGYTFPVDQIVEIKEKINLPDENGNWKQCSGLIKKQDEIIDFDISGKKISVAALHKFADKDLNEVFAKQLRVGDKLANGLEVKDIKYKGIPTSVYGVQIESDKHLYQDAQGIVHHNTYTCRKTMNSTPSELEKMYFKGNVGKSITSCCAFFYKHSNGYFIMLDDNDAMLMSRGVKQDIKLFFKAILDPDALEQPILVPTTVLANATAAIEEYDKMDDKEIKAKKRIGDIKKEKELNKQQESRKPIKISIDKECLREGIFRLSRNDQVVIEEEIPLSESMDLYYHLYDVEKPVLREHRTREDILRGSSLFRKLSEARRKADEDEDEYDPDDELFDGDEPVGPRRKSKKSDDDILYDPNGMIDEDVSGMPASFIFDSSVCFISNLTRDEIDPAVFDRFITVRVELTPIEFMNKLSEVINNLGSLNPAVTKISPDQWAWAKGEIYIILEGIVEKWATGQPIGDLNVDIKKRTLTFRLAQELANDLLMLGRSRIQKMGLKGTLSNEATRAKVLPYILKPVVTKALRKLVLGE